MTQLFRQLEITNISGDDLKDARLLGSMKVYAILCISGDPFLDPTLGFKTPTDYKNGVNPRWNNVIISFTIHEPSLQTNTLNLNFRLYTERTLGDRDVGEFTVPVKNLFNLISSNPNAPPHLVSCPVYNPSKQNQGTVNFAFSFGRPFAQQAMLPPPRLVELPSSPSPSPSGEHVGSEFEIPRGYESSQDYNDQVNSNGGDYCDDQADSGGYEDWDRRF